MVGRIYQHRAEYWGVLGTEAAVQLQARTPEQAHHAEQALFATIDRLSAIFNRFDAGSELNRWQRGEVAHLSPELLTVLERASFWQRVSGGAFHAGADALAALWDEATQLDRLPEQSKLDEVLAQLQAPLLLPQADGGYAPPDYSVNLNALAKGFIVDRAAAAALQQEGIYSVQLNIGGDLCHLGRGECVAAVSDPRQSAMNASKVATVRLSGSALASSGHSMRGRTIAGKWYSHLLDPRSGQCVNHLDTAAAGASVVAPSCMDADALATVLTVLDVEAALALCQQQGYAALLTLANGQVRRSAHWAQYQIFALPLNSLLNRLKLRLAL